MADRQKKASQADHFSSVPSGLLKWYAAHRRQMPWRAQNARQANPYHVLLSELMLQQTQVATVIPYFERFTQALPTLEHLARASEQEVLRLWQGLGYYSRARNLHRAAKQVIAEFSGLIPGDPDLLRKLPGIGPYTAGAVASIAFGTPAALVDGNVARVLIRLEAMHAAPNDRPALKKIWALARNLVQIAHAENFWPGDFNQALMELGATLCTPRQPDCKRCPLRTLCQAHLKNLQEKLPLPARRPEAKIVRSHVVAISRNGRLLFHQRPDTGLWAGLWEMPAFDGTTLKKLPERISRDLGLNIGSLEKIGQFTHLTTHRRFQMTLWKTSATGGRKPAGSRWEKPGSLSHLPLANLQQRALRMLQSTP